MYIELTNKEIYDTCLAFMKAFDNYNEYMPGKINFYFTKNKKLLLELAQEIEEARLNIIEHYGTPSTQYGVYDIPEENRKIVNQELDDLLNTKQTLKIYTISFNDLDKLSFNTEQMEALLFMIEEPEEADMEEE